MSTAVEVGEDVTFNCTATSNASLTFSWVTTASVTLPDPVTEGSDSVQGLTSRLELMDVTVDHRGDYSCVVENERGNKTSQPAILTVIGKCL